MPRRSRRPRTTLLILVLASVTIITLDARGDFHSVTSGARSVASDAFSPVRSGVDAIIEPIGSFLAGSVHYGAVRQQNQKLQDELAQLRAQQETEQNAQQAVAQLQQLASLYNLSYVHNLQMVPAQVIDYGTSNFASTIEISVGRSQGVSLNEPVLSGGGDLIGQVVQANHSSATVRLITDGQSTVGTQYGTSGSLAVVNGQGAGKPLTAQLVPSNTILTPGEVFATSGYQGGTFPAGIPVARVISSKNGLTTSQESVSLAPLANLNQLRYVGVLLWGATS